MKVLHCRIGQSRQNSFLSLWRARLCMPLLLLTLVGCVPKAEAPDAAVDVPQKFDNASAKPASPVPPDWWRSFRSPELTRLMEQTAAGNFDIASAAARIEQADALARIAGAPLLPQVTGAASLTQNKSASLIGANSPTRTLHQVNLNASWEIDFWGKNREALRAAQDNAFASRFDRDTVALTSLAATVNAYIGVLSSRERVRIANENLASAARILTLIRQRLSVGTATALDEAQQESLVANLRASIPPLRQQAGQNEAALGLLTGKGPERLKVSGASLNALAVPRIAPGLPSALLMRRPDIQSAEAQLDGANANLNSARAAFFPTIQLTGQGGFESLALKTLFNGPSAFYSLAAGLTQPIFDGGRLQGQFAQQKGKQDELVQLYRKSIISAFTDVEKALIAIRELAQQENLLRASLNASRKAYTLAETRLREGTIDLVTVLQTQQTLFQAQDSLAQVRLLRLQAAVALYQALGGGASLQIAGG
jgi:outer membrane protein, multidrug efflux system